MKLLRLLRIKTLVELSPLPHNPATRLQLCGRQVVDYLTSDVSGGNKGEGLRILLACS